MKKKFTATLALALTLVLCVAFGGGCNPHLLNKDVPLEYEVNLYLDKNITETLRIMVPSNLEAEKKYMEALRNGFKEIYPNVTIEFDERTVSDEQYVTSVNSAIASGNVPDLFWTNTAYYYYLISKKAVINLEPYYTVAGACSDDKRLDLEADYYKSLFDMSTYDGRIYIVPRSMDSVITFVNTELLAAAGIDFETDERLTNDWTWDDCISVSREVAAWIQSPAGQASKFKSSYALEAELSWEAVYNAMMLSYGVEVFDENGNIAVDSEETKKLANDIRALRAEGRVMSRTEASLFGGGNSAFVFSSAGPANMAVNSLIADNFDALPFPLIGENPKIGCGFVGYGISATAEGVKRDLAWAFLHYMISQEGQMTLINGGLATPSIRVDLAEEKQWSKGFQDLNLDAWLVHGDKKVATNFFMAKEPSCANELLTSVQSFMKDVCDSTSISVDMCVKRFVERIEEAIAQ